MWKRKGKEGKRKSKEHRQRKREGELVQCVFKCSRGFSNNIDFKIYFHFIFFNIILK